VTWRGRVTTAGRSAGQRQVEVERSAGRPNDQTVTDQTVTDHRHGGFARCSLASYTIRATQSASIAIVATIAIV